MPLDELVLKPEFRSQVITEIQSEEEKTRRAEALKRHDIYRDGGKRFLIEQIRREFNEESIKEMRFAPINLLKKIINKKSGIYRSPVVRRPINDADKDLVSAYENSLELNSNMTKANRYLNLFSNTSLYLIPSSEGLELSIVPPYLYSIVPNGNNMTKVDVWLFNSFKEETEIFQNIENPSPATGRAQYNTNKGVSPVPSLIASNSFEPDQTRDFILWSDNFHYTFDSNGVVQTDQEKGDEQFVNPFGISPVVNLTKPRDNEPWAKQGADIIDLTLAIQSGWSDLLSIAKEQGFSLLTIISEEEPKKKTFGLNRAVWLKQKQDGPQPSMSYVTANSPLAEYKDLLMDLLGLLLTTNDMSPSEVSGSAGAQTTTSGFHALIEQSSTIEAIEADKPIMMDAEKSLWKRIAIMHNKMIELDMLTPEMKSLGRFTEDFGINIAYGDIKPIQSEKEVQDLILERDRAGHITRRQVLKRLNPESSDEDIENMIKEIDEDKALVNNSLIDRLKKEEKDAENKRD